MHRRSRLWTPGGIALLAVVALALSTLVMVVGDGGDEGPADAAPLSMGPRMSFVAEFANRHDDAQAVAPPVIGDGWDGDGWLFVATEVGRGLAVYDLRTQQPVAWIHSPDSPVPHHPYISPDQRWVIANARYGDEIMVVDTHDDFATRFLAFPPGEDGEVAGPLHGTFAPDGQTYLVALQRSGRLGVVDLSGAEPEIAEVIDIGGRPRDVAITPDGARAFVSMQRESTVGVVDLSTWEVRYITRSATDYTERGSGSGGSMSSDGSLYAVSNTLDDEVVIIDVESEEVVHRVPDVPGPVNVEFLGHTHRIATGNRADGSVTFIDADRGELLRTVETGGGANIAYLGPRGNIWVSHNGAGYVTVIDPESLEIVREVETGLNPHWIYFSPWGTRAFVSNWGEASVSVLDTLGFRELGKIPTPLNPNGLAIKTDVSRAEAEAAVARAEERGVAGDIALASEMILPEPRDEQEATFLNTCTQCHDIGRIVRNNASGEQWVDIVHRMRGNGAQMTDEEMRTIIGYLQEGRQSDLDFGTRYDQQAAAGDG